MTPRQTRHHTTLIWGLMAALGLLVLALAAPSAHAQSGLAKARQSYQRCFRLLEDNKACDALEVCREGLKAKEIDVLKDLTSQARRQCAREKRSKRKRCPKGQIITQETKGQCCWPGQVWATPAGEDSAQCIGTPTQCPDGFEADGFLRTCRRKTCDEDGRINTEDGHCCWAGQAFSQSRNMCIGFPQCPQYFTVKVVNKKSADGKTYPVEECFRSDKDEDGVQDIEDLCPNESEDPDGFEDEDGCPDPDNDLDGVCDASFIASAGAGVQVRYNCRGSDTCPLVAEDPDGFEDDDGCPEEDNDQDGLVDADDKCPNEAEDFDGDADTDGCPEQSLAELQPPEPEANVLAILGWTSLGTGAALMITGGVLNLVADSERDKVLSPDQTTGPVIQSVTQAEVPDVESRANTLDTAGVVTWSIGGALVLTGATLLIIDALRDDEAEVDTQRGVSFGGAVRDDEVFLLMQGRF